MSGMNGNKRLWILLLVLITFATFPQTCAAVNVEALSERAGPSGSNVIHTGRLVELS